MIDRLPVDLIEAFVRVADRQSFSAAARELGVSPSALSQKVRALEGLAGVALLSRSTRHVGLTQAGAILLAGARPALEAITLAYDDARNLQSPAGLLRLHVPPGTINLLIEPILKGFLANYPKVEIEVIASNARADLIQGGFDAAISFGEALEPDVVALRLAGPVRFCVVGTPDYFTRFGTPRHPQDLRAHNCARLRIADDHLLAWVFREGGRTIQMPVTGNVMSNDYGLILSAATQGIALAYVAEQTVRDHLQDGRLRSVLPDYLPMSEGVYLYYPNRAQVLPKLRAFIDHVQTHADG